MKITTAIKDKIIKEHEAKKSLERSIRMREIGKLGGLATKAKGQDYKKLAEKRWG